jgi:cell wall-associated NlpC family hydrolase
VHDKPFPLHWERFRTSFRASGTSTAVAFKDTSGVWDYGGSNIDKLTLTDLTFTKPGPFAAPRGEYIAVEGMASPNTQVQIDLLDADSSLIRSLPLTVVDASGRWERVITLTSRVRRLAVKYPSNTEYSDFIDASRGSIPDQAAPLNYEILQVADVIVSASTDENNPQRLLYGAEYSHVSIYAGPDETGTPMITEAVPGSVKTRDLDKSDAYLDRALVVILRARTPLTFEARVSIAERAKSRTGAPYWSVGTFAATMGLMRTYWDSASHRVWPSYERDFAVAAARLWSVTTSDETFVCSSLVYYAYAPHRDLHWLSNRPFQGYLSDMDPELQEAVRREFVFPDTIATSPALERVN